MREILFRAWNGIEMIENVVVGKYGAFFVNPENGDGLNPQDRACLSQNTTRYHENIPIMQYVNWSDKNETKIFEGDIVKSDWGYGFIPKIVDMEEFYYAKLECTLSGEIEVIGNIYENPELLK